MVLKSTSNRVRKALRILKDRYQIHRSIGRSSFEVLVSTIISQKTEQRNTRLAFERLRASVGSTPEAILGASVEEIKECLRPAGLYNVKAMRLKEIAAAVLEREGGLEGVLSLPNDQARRELMSLPGVGYKTADVLLSFVGGRPVFPVDTHISRIAHRWGVVGERAGYEEIRKKFEEIIPGEKRREAHLLLIEFGREFCRARDPRCAKCPVWDHCSWEGKTPR